MSQPGLPRDPSLAGHDRTVAVTEPAAWGE